MSAPEIFYVVGMAVVTVGFPSMLVVMWFLDRDRAARLGPILEARAEALARAHAQPPALRRAV